MEIRSMSKELRAALERGAAVRVRPFAEAMDVHPNAIYEAIKRGEIGAVHVGRAVRIPAPVARRLLGLGAA